jgi:CHASE1-domain containing sensor protein
MEGQVVLEDYLVVGLLVTGFESRSTWKDARVADRRRFEAGCESMWERLESQIETHQHGLERFQDFTECQWPVDLGEWNNFVHTVYPEINCAGLAEIRFVALSSSLWRRNWCFPVVPNTGGAAKPLGRFRSGGLHDF